MSVEVRSVQLERTRDVKIVSSERQNGFNYASSNLVAILSVSANLTRTASLVTSSFFAP
jgi:hypothetical protein